MIGPRDTNVVQIPIDQITVVNPRSRGKHKFRQIVANISHLGLKKPITVVQRGTRDEKPVYELVCGQGRLEACKQLGDATVPALVIEATREELMLMSLAENLARRKQTCVALMQEIATLKDKGNTFQEIAEKTDLHPSYVKGILRLLKQGEHRLLRAVEKGQIPVSVAVTIASSDDEEVQRALAEAYESNDLRGKQLLRARRLIEARRLGGKAGGTGRRRASKEMSAEALMQAYKKETSKQRMLVQKAKLCETRLLFVGSALKKLFADEALVSMLQASGLDALPEYLADQVGRKAG